MLVCKIKKNFKNFKLDVDFEMENDRLGFLGASGSGKSLTLKAIGAVSYTHLTLPTSDLV